MNNMNKVFEVGEEFDIDLLSINAEVSKVNIYPKDLVSYLQILRDLVNLNINFKSFYSSYLQISLDDHRFNRDVRTKDQTLGTISAFISLGHWYKAVVSVAPSGPGEGNYWYYLDDNNIVTKIILVDSGG